MVVIERHSAIFSNTGRTEEVSPLITYYEMLQKVPIVDAALLYMCTCTDKYYLMVTRNVLHVPTMKNNLILQFIMREAGVKVNDTTMIQMSEQTVEYQSIYVTEVNLGIPLLMWVVF